MKREKLLKTRQRTLRSLGEAVEAMKALSTHHFRECRQTLPAAQDYRDELNEALNEIGVSQSIDFMAPPALLVIVSDLGLCGDYNTRLVQYAVGHRQREDGGPFYCVGRRPRAMLTRNRIAPDRLYPAPASVAGLPGLLLKLAQDLLEDFSHQKMSSLLVVSARFEGAGRFSPLLTRVLPIQPAHAAMPIRPTKYQSQRRLEDVAVREYLYTTLYELLLDALAAEHGMRLVAAESARGWLDEASESVRRQLSAVRRESTTQEVLDIVAGFDPRRAFEDVRIGSFEAQ